MPAVRHGEGLEVKTNYSLLHSLGSQCLRVGVADERKHLIHIHTTHTDGQGRRWRGETGWKCGIPQSDARLLQCGDGAIVCARRPNKQVTRLEVIPVQPVSNDDDLAVHLAAHLVVGPDVRHLDFSLRFTSDR